MTQDPRNFPERLKGVKKRVASVRELMVTIDREKEARKEWELQQAKARSRQRVIYAIIGSIAIVLGLFIWGYFKVFSSGSSLTTTTSALPITSSSAGTEPTYIENREATSDEISASKGPDNVKPDAGDVIVPLPGNRHMVFRKVFLGVGENPFRQRRFQMGSSHSSQAEEPMMEKPITASIRGAFLGKDPSGNLDAYYLIGKYDVTVGPIQCFWRRGSGSTSG